MKSNRISAFASPTSNKLRTARVFVRPLPTRTIRSIVKAENEQIKEENEDDFESRLAALKRAKGETPYGEGVKAVKGKAEKTSESKTSSQRPTYDFNDETLYFESAPHRGDLAINVALGVTLVWLPLSIAALGRAAFVKYRFTDRRISCITTAPWQTEQLDAAYQEVKDVVSIGRGVGLWGDMVVTLRDGSKIEMRALPRFRELQEYILKRRDELMGDSNKLAAGVKQNAAKGFSS